MVCSLKGDCGQPVSTMVEVSRLVNPEMRVQIEAYPSEH